MKLKKCIRFLKVDKCHLRVYNYKHHFEHTNRNKDIIIKHETKI